RIQDYSRRSPASSRNRLEPLEQAEGRRVHAEPPSQVGLADLGVHHTRRRCAPPRWRRSGCHPTPRSPARGGSVTGRLEIRIAIPVGLPDEESLRVRYVGRRFVTVSRGPLRWYSVKFYPIRSILSLQAPNFAIHP